MKVTKAVISVAGFGTRWLPYTKTIEKCMVPVMNRPWIDYVVQDCVTAGIDHIIFVVNERHDQLKQYYSDNNKLQEYLLKRGKQAELELIDTTPQGLTIDYVVQETRDGFYGTSVPVWLAKDKIDESEKFLSLNGDDMLVGQATESELANVLAKFQDSDAEGLAVGFEVDKADVSRYGIFQISEQGLFQGIVEKPSIDQAPSNVANASTYIFPSAVFEILDEQISKPPNQAGEYYITDVVTSLAEQSKIMAYTSSAKFLDGGTPEKWLAAVNYLNSR